MSDNIDRLVSFICEAKPKDVEGRHTTPSWMARIPKEDVPAVLRFLRAQGLRSRAIYRDQSGKKRYAKGRYYTSGWAKKDNATHADIYEQPPGEFSSRGFNVAGYVGGYQLMSDATKLRHIKAALNGKKTNNPEVLKALLEKPVWAYTYATKAMKSRWPEAEEIIAKSNLKNDYVKAFPDAKLEWALKGWVPMDDVWGV